MISCTAKIRLTTTRFLLSICIISELNCDPALVIKPGANTTARFSAVMRVTAEFSALQRSAKKSSLNEKSQDEGCKKKEAEYK
jgi:hypothetical protein